MAEHDRPHDDDTPDTGDRGWRGLARDPGERETFLLIAALLAIVVAATVIWGLPGLFLSFLLLTLLIMVVLVIISVGS